MYVGEFFHGVFVTEEMFTFRAPASAGCTRTKNHLWNYLKIFYGRAIYRSLISCCHDSQGRGTVNIETLLLEICLFDAKPF